jgi:hypothetical protein
VKEVSYVGDSFVTGDAIADAVLEYGVVLANSGRADMVAVPGIGRDGDTEFDLLIGPASQLSAARVPHTGPELTDAAFVADIHERIERHQYRPRAGDPSPLDWDI